MIIINTCISTIYIYEAVNCMYDMLAYQYLPGIFMNSHVSSYSGEPLLLSASQTKTHLHNFVQHRPNVFDVGPTLYKCITHVFLYTGIAAEILFNFAQPVSLPIQRAIISLSLTRYRTFINNIITTSSDSETPCLQWFTAYHIIIQFRVTITTSK